MKIALLGTGRMGQAIAGRLLDGGHELVVWNRTAGRAGDLLDRGATEARSITAAVAGVEVAITSLPNDDVVRAVALGEDGIRSAGREELVYADASTVSPETSAALGDSFARFASMPILGSPALVASGDAVYLLGADPATRAVLDPVLPDLTSAVHRYDEPRLAATAKLAVNLLLLDGIVALAESFCVGRAGGLSDDQLRDLLAENNMVAPGLGNRFEGVLTGRQEPMWAPGLGAKDARLAVDLATGAGGDLPVTAAARDRYAEAAEGSAGEDIVAVADLYRS